MEGEGARVRGVGEEERPCRSGGRKRRLANGIEREMEVERRRGMKGERRAGLEFVLGLTMWTGGYSMV